MTRNVCFRPTKKFVDDLNNYRQIHHIDSDSEAMRKICEEWRKQKHDLETLRGYLEKDHPQPPETKLQQLDCLKDLKFATFRDQKIACGICKKRTPDIYNQCQNLKKGEE